MRLSHNQKEQALAGIRLLGTKKSGALAAGISIDRLNTEIKKSAIFKKRINEALATGKNNLADNALEVITNYALNPPIKTDRNVLTAAIALANAFIPGFRGEQTRRVEGRVDHDVRVITAVPRPNYDELPQIDKEKVKLLNRGKPVLFKDRKRNNEASLLEKL